MKIHCNVHSKFQIKYVFLLPPQTNFEGYTLKYKCDPCAIKPEKSSYQYEIEEFLLLLKKAFKVFKSEKKTKLLEESLANLGNKVEIGSVNGIDILPISLKPFSILPGDELNLSTNNNPNEQNIGQKIKQFENAVYFRPQSLKNRLKDIFEDNYEDEGDIKKLVDEILPRIKIEEKVILLKHDDEILIEIVNFTSFIEENLLNKRKISIPDKVSPLDSNLVTTNKSLSICGYNECGSAQIRALCALEGNYFAVLNSNGIILIYDHLNVLIGGRKVTSTYNKFLFYVKFRKLIVAPDLNGKALLFLKFNPEKKRISLVKQAFLNTPGRVKNFDVCRRLNIFFVSIRPHSFVTCYKMDTFKPIYRLQTKGLQGVNVIDVKGKAVLLLWRQGNILDFVNICNRSTIREIISKQSFDFFLPYIIGDKFYFVLFKSKNAKNKSSWLKILCYQNILDTDTSNTPDVRECTDSHQMVSATLSLTKKVLFFCCSETVEEENPLTNIDNEEPSQKKNSSFIIKWFDLDLLRDASKLEEVSLNIRKHIIKGTFDDILEFNEEKGILYSVTHDSNLVKYWKLD